MTNKLIIPNSQQDVVIDIPLHVTDIGIKISGGADSAVLCYILALYKKTIRPDLNIHPVTSISSLKKYQQIFSDRVLLKISELLDIKFGTRYVNDVDSNNYVEEQFVYVQNLVKQGKFQKIIMGVTRNPPMELDYLIVGRPEGRDDINMPTEEGNCYGPFKNIDKQGIHELYITLGILEDIFPLTRSCEAFTTDFTAHCEECWFCKERYWGFGRYI